MIKDISIYTDGACSGNPGPGGWGTIIVHPDGSENILSGGEEKTTNNRMELTAVIEGLEKTPAGTCAVVVTDSEYVKKGITEWIKNWVRNGWKTASKKPVKNRDLWQQLLALTEKRNISWEWVKGHSGHPLNERCDSLARSEIDKFR